jgi:serine O-acetyltransferase
MSTSWHDLSALEPSAPPAGLFVPRGALPTLDGLWGDANMDALSLWSLGRRLARWRVPWASRITRKLGLVLFSAYLPSEAEIGEDTVLGYGGIGVFVHPRARIGRRCHLSHFVSIGGMGGQEGVPTLGDYVRVGTGARILGPVHIGDFATVGANSVVVRDVPAGTVVFGVPARVVKTSWDPAADYERETGRRVAPEDRARALRHRPQAREPIGASASGRNVLREDPGLFEVGSPLLGEDELPAYERSRANPSKPRTEEGAASEPPASEPHTP